MSRQKIVIWFGEFEKNHYTASWMEDGTISYTHKNKEKAIEGLKDKLKDHLIKREQNKPEHLTIEV